MKRFRIPLILLGILVLYCLAMYFSKMLQHGYMEKFQQIATTTPSQELDNLEIVQGR